MPDFPEAGTYSLELGGDWALDDLSVFRQYLNVYSVIYALQVGVHLDESQSRIVRAFEVFPWKGGWSAVDFYERLRYATPHRHRPRIVSIRYASPGFIELLLLVPISKGISMIIDNACSSIERISRTYTMLYKEAAYRKLLRTDARTAAVVGRGNQDFCEYAASEMVKHIGLEHERELRHLAANPVARMKITFSVWRRIRELAKTQNNDQVKF